MKPFQKTVLFYSSVKSKRMFSLQEYYKTDILILKKLGFKVKLSISAWDYFRFWEYDIAFIYFFRYGFFPALLSRLFFRKVVFTGGIDNLNRETTRNLHYRLQQLFFSLCYLVANRVVFVSNADMHNVGRFLPIHRMSKHKLSWHVIDYEKYIWKGDVTKEKLISTIAWMQKVQNITRKGVDRSVCVFAELLKLDPTFKMVIIGPTGAETSYLFDLIQKLGLADKVIVTGALPEEEKILWLKKSSFYLQLSEYEGFGIAAIEALASGNVVLHSNKGGLSDAIGSFGVIVNDTDNYAAIASIIQYNYTSTGKQYNFHMAMEHVGSNFQINRRFNDFDMLFRDLLNV
jgi:glycosyltransferase involved in cell wall biosynthesis